MHGSATIPCAGARILHEPEGAAPGALEFSGSEYAFRSGRLPDGLASKVKARVNRLARVGARSLPTIHRFLTVGDRAWVIFERCAGAPLLEYIHREVLSDEDVITVAHDVATALAALHDAGEVHGAVSLTSIVAADGGGWSLRDYGACFSEHFAELGRPSLSQVDRSGDMQALGRVLWACLMRETTDFDFDLERLRNQKPQFALLLSRLVGAPSAQPLAGAREFLAALQSQFTTAVDESDAERALLITRRRGFQRLRQIWAEEGQGLRAVILRGPPGAGKTHLVQAFLRAQRAGAGEALTARCRHWEVSPFAAVRQLLECFVFRGNENDQARLAELADISGSLARLLRPLSPAFQAFMPGGRVPDSEAADDVYSQGLGEILARVLARAPTILVVEDVQWLDEGSRKVLRRALELSCARTLLIATARSGVDSTHDAQRFFGPLQASIVWDHTLGPLGAHEASQLVSDYLGSLPIDPGHARALALYGDGTPLSVLEVVRSVLDEGLLFPEWSEWRLDVVKAARLSLPSNTSELIAQRLLRAPAATTRALRLAAIMGNEFDIRVLCATHDVADVSEALAGAQRLDLVESTGPTSYRFVHQCVIDALTVGLDAAAVQQLHAQAALALQKIHPEPFDAQEPETVLKLAGHLSAAAGQCDDETAFRANLAAGILASQAYDNTAALRFLRHANELATSEDRRSTGVRRLMADVQLRLGDFEESLHGFQSALETEQTPVQRAQILSNIALIHEARYDSAAALGTLNLAFSELGERVPGLTAWTLVALPGFLLSSPDVDAAVVHGTAAHEIELFCHLVFQNNRLSMVESNVGAAIDGTVRCVRAARRLGPSQALSKSLTMASLLMAMLGRSDRGARFIARALKITREINDPPATAQVLWNQAGYTAWLGDVDGALALGEELLNVFHSWLIPSELAIIAFNQELLESVRGHCRSAWEWLRRAIPRAVQYEGSPVVTELFAARCRVATVRLGLDEKQEGLLHRIESACLSIPPESGYHSWLYGARVRMFTDVGDLGEPFEELVREFSSQRLNPRRVHLVTTEYYVAVAHARVHAWLHADTDSPGLVNGLEQASKDLRLAARLPLLRAHALAIEGYVWLSRAKYRKAADSFAQAHELGVAEKAPWVLYAVARGRAHAHRRQGKERPAQREALLALSHAVDNGAVYWAKWISEEFALVANSSGVWGTELNENDASGASAGMHHHLQSFVRINRLLSKELAPEEQGKVILDEMIRTLRAERGYLYMRDTSEGRNSVLSSARDLVRVAARDATRADLPEADVQTEEDLNRVLQARAVLTYSLEGDTRTDQAMMAPLVIQDSIVGVVSLTADSSRPAFSQLDGEVLQALCGQVPITLELAQALRDRERLSEDLRQSQKMEAIGRLAGGIAHDFNNMLAAICVAVESVLAESPTDSEHRPDLETIRRAADRATRLTRQLLAFSRRQVFDARPMDLNQTVRDIAPMLTRLLGERIEVEVDLDSSLHLIKADAAQLEQVLVNLAVNARDAMPTGGRLRLRTRNILLQAGQKPVLDAGDYVLLSVADTGEGMDEDTRRRIFEPFFTTKTSESGTGLGLAIAYGVVRQSGGYIDLESAVGVGTEFRIYLPRTHEQVQTIPPVSTVRGGPRQGRILLVDDEPLVRHALGRTLRRMGYEVTNATGGREAIRILSHSPAVDLVITDVIMPEMNGVEMVEKLSAMGIRAKVLYISGYADGVLTKRADLGDRVEFMQKPLTNDELAAKIRDLLGQEEQSRPGGVS